MSTTKKARNHRETYYENTGREQTPKWIHTVAHFIELNQCSNDAAWMQKVLTIRPRLKLL